MGYLDFFIQYFKHPLQMGTFTESSKSLVEAVVGEMRGKTIVELGAGRGGHMSITRGILSKLGKDGRLVSLEINPKLYEQLTMIHDSRFAPVLDSAENFEFYENNADCIVSGLPLTLLGFDKRARRRNKRIREKMLTTSSSYPLFIQYGYIDVSELLQQYFREVRVIQVPKNIPSAHVYVCTNGGFNL